MAASAIHSAWPVVLGGFLAGTLLWADPPARARGFKMQECEQVVAVLEDPLDRYGDELGRKLLEIVCRKMQELAPVFGMPLPEKPILQVFIPEDLRSFHRHTGRGVFTLAIYSSLRGIITQPSKGLKWLKTLGRLEQILTHELVHFLVDRTVGRRCPQWLNEGLAQWFEGLRPEGKTLITEGALEALERRWNSRGVSVATLRRDYNLSLALVARIIHQVGQGELLGSLPDLRKHRDPLNLEIKSRTLRKWLFVAEPTEPAGEAEPQIMVERFVEWEKELAEESGVPEGSGERVYDFKKAGPGNETGITPLPLEEMIRRAEKKRP